MSKNAKQVKPQLTGPMAEIEAATGLYSVAHAALAGTIGGLEDEIAQVKAKYRARLLTQVAQARTLKAQLRTMLEAHPELFERPRTVVFAGIKVGFQKGKGSISIESPARTMQLIRKHLPDQAEILIVTEEKPNKDAIAALEGDDLKRIGCAITGTGDKTVITSVEGDIEKAIDALLKEEAA